MRASEQEQSVSDRFQCAWTTQKDPLCASLERDIGPECHSRLVEINGKGESHKVALVVSD